MLKPGLQNKLRNFKYGDLVGHGEQTLARVICEVTGKRVDKKKVSGVVEKHSLEGQTKCKSGEEYSKSFLRKGASGDWKKIFTPRRQQFLINRPVMNLLGSDMSPIGRG
ncbi:MAG: hypothetical protein KJO81_12720 [Gammaproteobacteria bacterium]|nr:hypothetical protein [Gammaproteobacteria bacterium]